MINIAAQVSIAPFRFDITPPIGHALLSGLILPASAYDDPLDAIGYVLLGANRPIVVCAIDWAGLMNGAHVAWRIALADVAGTTPDRVAVQCVHQHNTPFVCPEARAAAAKHDDLPEMFDPIFLDLCLDRARAAVRDAMQHAQLVTHVAHAESAITNVASNRRVARDSAGQVRAMRRSSCTDPELLALPEGTIDPMLQSVAFFNENRKIVSCHYYATHPMSYYSDGRVSSDFCGLARKQRQQDEPTCTHIYFTGCAGDVAAGKYNDGSPAARRELTERIHSAIVASETQFSPQPLEQLQWRTEAVLPSPRPTPDAAALEATIADSDVPRSDRLQAAFRLGWLRRVDHGVPLVLSCLRLNDLSILHLPGEMFVEYQLRARSMRRGLPVAVAAYGDGGPWYVPTKEEYRNNGYEVEVAFCREDVDEIFMTAIRRLLAG